MRVVGREGCVELDKTREGHRELGQGDREHRLKDTFLCQAHEFSNHPKHSYQETRPFYRRENRGPRRLGDVTMSYQKN